MKICTKCNIEKENTEFYFHKRGELKREASCIACARIYYHKYKNTDKYKEQKKRDRKRNKENGHHKIRYALWGRNYKLHKAFGITDVDYKRMLNEQKCVCAICGCPETHLVSCSDTQKRIRPLSVDHDHETGKVRALLCDDCNSGISRFKENIEYLANAISYIEKHKAGALMESIK